MAEKKKAKSKQADHLPSWLVNLVVLVLLATVAVGMVEAPLGGLALAGYLLRFLNQRGFSVQVPS